VKGTAVTTQIDLENIRLGDDPEVQNEVFMAAFNSGKGAIFDQLYRDDAISNLSGGPLSGQERTEAITRVLATNPTLVSTVKEVYVAGDTSLIVVDFDLRTADEDGAPVRIQGICTDVLVREPTGEWMMAVDRPIAKTTTPL
jgi:ketosteroid isomerase-like protein